MAFHPYIAAGCGSRGGPDRESRPAGSDLYSGEMPVEVRLPTLLRPHAGGAASVTAEGATVGELFTELVERFPGLSGQLADDSGGLHKFVNVYRNDDDIRYLDQLDTKLTDGDVVSVLPAVAGG